MLLFTRAIAGHPFSAAALIARVPKLFSDTLSNLNNCEKTAQNTIFHLVKSIS